MINKLYLYTAHASIINVDFLIFDNLGVLKDTLEASLNHNGVWEAVVPITITAGYYTAVGKSNSMTLGKEDIYWNGTELIPLDQAMAKAVRTELSTELVHLVSLQNGLTSGQSTMLLELFRLMGLDPMKPLIVTKTSRTVQPEIVQTIDDNGTRTIVTRS